MMKINPLNAIDFYKADHRNQYPEGTELVYSNFTPRSNRLFNGESDSIIFFGLQGFIKWFLIDTWNEGFFKQPKEKVVAAYKRRMDTSLGPGAVTVEHIEALHDLGYLPLKIKALPEGSRVPMKVPVLTVLNTNPEFFWLVNYLESVMSAELWKSCTTATIAAEYKKIMVKYAKETGSPVEFCDLQGHDFSFRGMSGLHDSAQSSSGHLLSFVGTDTVSAIDYLENYYGANADEELIGCSVPATEHSVMCMGSKDGEIETFKRLINDLYPTGIVSIVSDTWDFWKVISEYTVELKEDILNRQPNALGLAKTVFRPDSGDPVEVLCGEQWEDFGEVSEERFKDYICDRVHDIVAEDTPHGEHGEMDYTLRFKANGKCYEAECDIEWNRHDKQYYFIETVRCLNWKQIEPTAEQLGAVETLWNIFGGTVTDKGYKVLHERVGLIYGDSITLERAEQIMKRLKEKGFASCNVVFGIGSYTYQYNTRDTFGFAMKATFGIVNCEDREIFKDPITDKGTKKSAKGLLRVEKEDGKYVLYDQQTHFQELSGELQVVFRNGKLYNEQTLSEIRVRVAEG